MGKKQQIKIGVIPAAGRGGRIGDLPLTRILPKPMLPILNKPILEYIIFKMKNLGIQTVYLIVGYRKEMIKEYFKDGSDFGVEICYLTQKRPSGIAQAVGLLEKHIKRPFLVILGDDFTVTKSLQNMVDLFYQKKAAAVTGVVKEKNRKTLQQTNYLILDRDNRIIKMVEKPKIPKSNLRGCGLYIFDPLIFSYLKKTPISKVRHQREITNTLDILAKEKKVYGVFIKGINVNINTLEDLRRATLLYLRKDKKW